MKSTLNHICTVLLIVFPQQKKLPKELLEASNGTMDGSDEFRNFNNVPWFLQTRHSNMVTRMPVDVLVFKSEMPAVKLAWISMMLGYQWTESHYSI